MGRSLSVGVVAAALLMAACGTASQPDQLARAEPEQLVETPARSKQDKAVTEASVPPTVTETSGPPTTEAPTTVPLPAGLGAGTHLVGADVQPGIYRATGESFGCYFERLSGVSGEFDDLIHNGNAPDGGQALVEILDTDYAFKSDGCSNWVPKDQPFGLDGTIPSGNWLVGVDIEPGTYRATGESFGCYYERLADLQGFEGLIANGNAPDGGSAVVEIADTDYAFSTDGCTAWEKINE